MLPDAEVGRRPNDIQYFPTSLLLNVHGFVSTHALGDQLLKQHDHKLASSFRHRCINVKKEFKTLKNVKT